MSFQVMAASTAKARLRLISVLLLLQVAAHAPDLYAQTHYVYLYTWRPPQKVFANGFQALGDDLNLLNYATASSLMTGFVTTTASYRNAQDHALAALQYTSGGRLSGYIYRISTDNTFYDLNLSVRHFFHQQRQAGTIEARHRSLMHDIERALPLDDSEQFVVPHRIPPGMIQSSTRVDLVSGADGRRRIEEGERRDNPNWVGYEDRRVTNPNPYPISWPEDDAAGSFGSCTPPIGAIDEGGAIGGNCTDVLAVAAGSAEGIEGAMHRYGPFEFADCSSSSSSKREKRDIGSATCPELRLINLSRLKRVLWILVSDL